MAEDNLFQVRNNFYLGNYQAAINAVNSGLQVDNEAQAIERDCFLYRSYIALGSYGIVLSEIPDTAPVPMQAVKLLATYLNSPDNKDIVLVTLKEWLNDPSSCNNPTLRLIAGIVYLHEDKPEESLKCTHNGTTLEMVAVTTHTLLKMSRVDLAEKESRALQQTDDDATLTQLALASVNIALGGAKLQEAFYILQELVDKYGSSPAVLNSMAVCHMGMGRWDEAEECLMEALKKSSNDPTTLQNLFVVLQHQRKSPEVANRFLTQLKQAAPHCEFLKARAAREAALDRVIANYAPASTA